jgi:hypothetical protein
MNSLFEHAPAMYASVMFHGASMLRRLRKLDKDTLLKVSDEAMQHSLDTPLQHYPDKKNFLVPSWSPDKLSGMQVVALMIFSLWILCNEKEDRCPQLVERWPIKEAVELANTNHQHD